MLETIPDKSAIEEAHIRIRSFVHRTPLQSNKSIDELAQASLWFKCENLQKIGAFKIRGATNVALQLSEGELRKGLATHSSGNHAQAVALTAKNQGVRAYIVMPSNSPQVKVDAVKGYGAEVILCEPTLEARESTLSQVVEDTGATFIHPYDHYGIIAGQATAAKEMLEDMEQHPDIIVAPVGGGGLLSGTALAAKYFSKNTKVIAAEPTGADDAYQSFNAGKIIPSVNPKTIADGLLTSVGERNYPVIKKHVSEIICVDDSEIIAAMRLVYERMKMVIEPSAAVPLAAILQQPAIFAGKTVGVIFSGGNVDLNQLWNNYS